MSLRGPLEACPCTWPRKQGRYRAFARRVNPRGTPTFAVTPRGRYHAPPVVGLLAACLAMAQAPQEFVLKPGASHEARGGIVFRLEEGGHKHGEGGLATGRWTLRFERGGERGELPFSASAPEDFYGEGYAFGTLFRMMGESPGGGVKLVLRPRTA